jgi:asparaginyl-tRNA synthetase
MSRSTVAELLSSENKSYDVTVMGWVRTFRANRFIALNDGSTINNIQCVVDFENTDESILKRITTGAAVSIRGVLQESQGRGQKFEIQVSEITVLGDSNPDEYPIQPKKHSFEFLRENAHLRIRTTTFSAVMRVRSALSFAVHKYFTENGFYNFHAPIITGADAEGAGEMFGVTTIDPNSPPLNENGDVDSSKDFFGKTTSLTISGQLEAETYAMALGKVYTFGPTFRAENSNTSRHLSEFWMIEPEVAFNQLEDNMDLAEDFIKSVISYINNFMRVSYTEAIEILMNSKPNKKRKFQFVIEGWGADLQSEHERYLVEKHYKCPVILFDYPANMKAFYMRLNDDQKTVRAMDVLFPGIGEIVGGSQREERLDVLKRRVKEIGIDEEELWWYLDTRKFGTAIHSGFGLGFERLVLFSTGMGNIRDVIPYPRTPLNAEF